MEIFSISKTVRTQILHLSIGMSSPKEIEAAKFSKDKENFATAI
jgi:hypothetical protein